MGFPGFQHPSAETLEQLEQLGENVITPQLLGKLMKETTGEELSDSELAEGADLINEFLAMFPPDRTKED